MRLLTILGAGAALLLALPDAARPGEEGISSLDWLQVQKLRARDGVEDDGLGIAVAIHGDVAAVGADPPGLVAGAVYVFERQENREWAAAAKLVPWDGADQGAQFGNSVATNGRVIVVGADRDDDLGTDSGAAYVFEQDPAGGGWRPLVKLLASDGNNFDHFGASLAMEGDRLFVGADSKEPPLDSGAVYVFEKDAATGLWMEVAKLQPSDGGVSDHFGETVTIDTDTLVVGAGSAGPLLGTAVFYVFERDGVTGEWVEAARLEPAEPDQFDFSDEVAISGETVFVGAGGDDDLAEDSGAVYVFEWNGAGGDWLETAKLFASDGAPGTFFGGSVAASGERLFVGALAGTDLLEGSGAVYVFEPDDTTGEWLETARLVASDGADGDRFGDFALAADGETLVAGAFDDDDLGAESGSAYVFETVGIGGSSTGINPFRARCRNRTTGQGVEIDLTGAHSWDCQAAGLLAEAGDEVALRVVGSALGFPISGAAAGILAEQGFCANTDTGQAISTDLDGSTVWNCDDLGLNAAPGDRIVIRVSGPASVTVPR